MSQKKNNSPSNVEKLQTRLAGETDALISIARLNDQTHVVVSGVGDVIAGMLASELCFGDHAEQFGAIFTAAFYLACLNNDEFYVKFDELYQEMQHQRVERRYGQEVN